MQQGGTRGEGGPDDGQTKLTESDTWLSSRGQDRSPVAVQRAPTVHTLHLVGGCRMVVSGISSYFDRQDLPGNLMIFKCAENFRKKTKVFYLLVKFDSVFMMRQKTLESPECFHKL